MIRAGRMIVGSVLLVVVAGVLLGVGLVRLDAALLYSSIGVSALSALTLAIGVRRAATVRADRGTIAVRPVVPEPSPPPPVESASPAPAETRITPPSAERPATRSVGRARVTATQPGAPATAQTAPVPVASPASVAGPPSVAGPASVVGQPAADQVGPELISEWDRVRAARLAATVLMDQRPWFHRVDCPYLFGPAEQAPVARAIERGAAPCGRCRPVSTLLAANTAAGGPGD